MSGSARRGASFCKRGGVMCKLRGTGIPPRQLVNPACNCALAKVPGGGLQRGDARTSRLQRGTPGTPYRYPKKTSASS
jgi:hypothetical protein